jgi:xylan 1,4-beta-xylosidase
MPKFRYNSSIPEKIYLIDPPGEDFSMSEVSRRSFLKLAAGATISAAAMPYSPVSGDDPVQSPHLESPAVETIHNPILTGFNPDPSILRVGSDYYIANSTFEWFPGVRIHHSTDLIHWQLLTHVLTRPSQLDLRGAFPSNGVWAPCLSYDGSFFYLIYTNMFNRKPRFWDCVNYLVTAAEIQGPWSEPVVLNASGFDPSLFHDSSGRKWLLNMQQDPRDSANHFGGIALQEYSPSQQKLIGSPKIIFTGTGLGTTEGPHLYQHNGWYYLICSEGGTGTNHAVTVARSQQIDGSYEVDPRNPMLTSAGHPELALQKAGHASLVETQTQEWYIAHLCARPLAPTGRCMLGRETALQKVTWTTDGWLRLANGGNTPQVDVTAPNLAVNAWAPEPDKDDFDASTLNPAFQAPREPIQSSWCSLDERPGFLRLRGRMSPNSRFDLSLVARRIGAFHVLAETSLDFSPVDSLQAAGLLAYYDEMEWYWLAVTQDASQGKMVKILQRDDTTYSELSVQSITWGRVYLRAVINNGSLQFAISPDGMAWTTLGGVLDATKLSDEYPTGRFTGSFFALSAMDLHGTAAPADFDYFTYRQSDITTFMPMVKR